MDKDNAKFYEKGKVNKIGEGKEKKFEKICNKIPFS